MCTENCVRAECQHRCPRWFNSKSNHSADAIIHPGARTKHAISPTTSRVAAYSVAYSAVVPFLSGNWTWRRRLRTHGRIQRCADCECSIRAPSVAYSEVLPDVRAAAEAAAGTKDGWWTTALHARNKSDVYWIWRFDPQWVRNHIDSSVDDGYYLRSLLLVSAFNLHVINPWRAQKR